ncbi:hypothetical protein K440DRAFT_611439 [Wilcoxina mikolae CBS 423.85]|nr:hypothetical protein K440DRAFT_611439 [Wilcoxina mikolae CBS 423.85]
MLILTILLLLPAFVTAASLPPFPTTNSTTYCNLTTSITYEDPWGPIFTEHAYTCTFPSSSPSLPSQYETPLTVPAPYSHPAGQLGSDPMIASRGTVEPLTTTYHRLVLQSSQKLTIPSYGCSILPHPARLSEGRYSNLFWGMRQLTNQSCLLPGEAREFVDVPQPWTADWRFSVANRGGERVCEWWQELANVAEALHYVCYYSELGTGLGERSGGVEAVAWGQLGEVRWCLRYSPRGWGEGVWEERCLGV